MKNFMKIIYGVIFASGIFCTLFTFKIIDLNDFFMQRKIYLILEAIFLGSSLFSIGYNSVKTYRKNYKEMGEEKAFFKYIKMFFGMCSLLFAVLCVFTFFSNVNFTLEKSLGILYSYITVLLLMPVFIILTIQILEKLAEKK